MPQKLSWVLLYSLPLVAVVACGPGEIEGCDQIGCTSAAPGERQPATNACDPAVLDACPGQGNHCDTRSLTCQSCPADTFNCDGVGDCESAQSCATGQLRGRSQPGPGPTPPPGCDPLTADACGGSVSYCDASSGSCTGCPPGTLNCDGTGACEPCDTGKCSAGKCALPPPPPPEPPPPNPWSGNSCGAMVSCINGCGSNATCGIGCASQLCTSVAPLLQQMLQCAINKLCISCVDGLTKACVACVKSACPSLYNQCMAHSC